MSFIGFSASVQAQEDNNYLSIPDFTIHRVTPVKTTTASSNKETSVTSDSKNKIIIIPPKLRTIEITEVKQQKQVEPAQKVNTPEKTETTAVADRKIIAQVETEPVKHQSENIIKEKSVNNSNDEIVSKINKINEKKQVSTKGDLETNSLAKETGNDFFRAFFSLMIVLLMILAFAWVYARVKGINPTAILTGKFAEKDLNRFNVISTSTLGQGKDIHLVEINGKQLVIGSTNNTINLLTEIPPEEIEKLKENRQHNQNDENADIDVAELAEDDLNCEPIEDIEDVEFMDPDFYSSKYSKVYKEYLPKQDD